MSKPRGHSNVRADQTEPHPTAPHRASVPIEGGATVYSVKPLPPLSLSREEWQEIGELMRWTYISSDNARDSDDEEISHESLCPQRVGGECMCGAFEHNERVRQHT